MSFISTSCGVAIERWRAAHQQSGGPAASQLENSRPALTMTRGVHVMAERSVLPLTPSVKPPLSKVSF